jgi:hypothetical protein
LIKYLKSNNNNNNFYNKARVAGLRIFLGGGIEVSPAELLLNAGLVILSDFLVA